TTSQTVRAGFYRKSADDSLKISVSTSNGLHWQDVWSPEGTGKLQAKVDLLHEVNGAYEILIKVSLQAASSAADAVLESLEIETVTMVNSKTQPRLNLGRNMVYVGVGDNTESIVFWPDLENDKYKSLIVEEKNMASLKAHPGYFGVLHPTQANEDAYEP